MKYLEIRNWREFQHYKDRNPPWIKLHYSLITSHDWVMMDDESKLLAIVCMMLASRNKGMVPIDPAYIKKVAHLSKLPNFKPLIECGFFGDASVLQADASILQADAIIEERRDRGETEARAKKRSAKVSLSVWESSNGVFNPHNTKLAETYPAQTLKTMGEQFRAKCGAQDYRYVNFNRAFESWDWPAPKKETSGFSRAGL